MTLKNVAVSSCCFWIAIICLVPLSKLISLVLSSTLPGIDIVIDVSHNTHITIATKNSPAVLDIVCSSFLDSTNLSSP